MEFYSGGSRKTIKTINAIYGLLKDSKEASVVGVVWERRKAVGQEVSEVIGSSHKGLHGSE